MARASIDSMMKKNNLYAFLYGETGSGKTMAPLSIRKTQKGEDVGYVLCAPDGIKSALTSGYRPVMHVIPGQGSNPFEPVMDAIADLTRDKAISTIVLDDVSVLSGRAVDFLSDGEGEKALGFQGWQEILAAFRRIEGMMELATRSGKSAFFTAWPAPPQVSDSLGGKVITEKGRPYLQGKAQMWLPGNCDIIARITSRFAKVKNAEGKVVSKYTSELHLHASEEWIAKTRWAFLPSPYPTDFKKMLADVATKSASFGK